MDKSALFAELKKKKASSADLGTPPRDGRRKLSLTPPPPTLTQRRLSMTPDDKETLLKSEDKVVRAALSLHVIHDVPLSELASRLEASGVPETLRKKAIKTIDEKTRSFLHKLAKSEQTARRAVGAPERSALKSFLEGRLGDDDDEGEAVGGVVVVETSASSSSESTKEDDALGKYRKMLKVGVPLAAAVAAAKKDGVGESKLKELDPNLKENDEDRLASYKKMLGLGIPTAAVRQKMVRDGVSRKDMDSLVPDDAAVQKLQTPLRQKKNVKAVHWKKLEDDVVEDTVWGGCAARSPGVEDDDLALLEEIFATAAAEKKKPFVNAAEDSSSSSSVVRKISLIADGRRASNVAIGLTFFARKFGDDERKVCEAAAKADDWLDAPRLRSLKALLPTDEEKALVKDYDKAKKAKTNLARPERFFLASLEFPDLASRIDAGIFMDEWDELAYDASRAAKVVANAADAVRESEDFAYVLKALLQLGNRLNEGRSTGGARGIALSSLDRFATAKGSDGTTLLDYLLQILHKRHKIHVLQFLDDLPSLADAAKLEENDPKSALDKLQKTINDFRRGPFFRKEFQQRTTENQQQERHIVVDECAATATNLSEEEVPKPKDNTIDEAFLERLRKCLDVAEPAVEALATHVAKAQTSKTKLQAYFAETAPVSEVFVTLDGFLRQLRAARDKHKRRTLALERESLPKEQRPLASRRENNTKDEPPKTTTTAAQKKKKTTTKTSVADDAKLMVSKVKFAYNRMLRSHDDGSPAPPDDDENKSPPTSASASSWISPSFF